LVFENKRRWFEGRNYQLAKIIPTGGRTRLIKDAKRHLKILRKLQCEKIIYFIDQHSDPCIPYTLSRLQVIGDQGDVLILVVVRELENWFLADSEAIKKVTGKNFNQHTDDIRNAKGIIKELFRKRKFEVISEIEIVNRMIPYFSFERAANKNRSLTRLISKL